MEPPSNQRSNNAHKTADLTVWRGSTSARKMEKLRPQPPRWPRLQHQIRWPRWTCLPAGLFGSLPYSLLWQLSVFTAPQSGQQSCLSRKRYGSSSLSVLTNRRKGLAIPPCCPSPGNQSSFSTALSCGATRLNGIKEKRKRHSTARRHLSLAPIVIKREPTMPVRH